MPLIILLLFFTLSTPVEAFKWGDIIRIAESQSIGYPETHEKRIYFYTGGSPLAAIETPDDQILRSTELSKQTIERTFTLGAANKIIGMADGVINVKYQVQDGVNNALKDTFMGFFEYQRRKTSEEILNSNLKAHLDCIKFLNEELLNNDFHNSSSIALLNNILSMPLAKNTFSFLQKIVLVLLILISSLKILDIAFLNSNTANEYSQKNNFKDFFRNLFFTLILLMTLDSIWKFIFHGFKLINSGFQAILENDSLEFSIFYNHESILAESWMSILNSYGYFPALILAFSDSISQFIFIISLLSSLVLIIFAKIFSPLLILNNLKKSSLSIFSYSSKILLSISILPFSFNFLHKIFSQLSVNNLSSFIYICFSILSLLLLSIIQIFFIFKIGKRKAQ